GRVVALPVATSIAVDVAAGDELTVGVVVAAKLAGTIRGTGAASATVAAGDHAALELRVAPPVACVAGGLYCGGDKLAGDPDTLYQCNAGGVPLARGACAAGCVVTPTEDDACRAAGGPCVEGGFYCGGDKLAGDPQALYRCVGGVGTAPQVCADGCVVRPGQDDACR
ncbi:MAG: hypothetical protein KC464_16370, partial [Myxococcales bacterium]|nr:hypothetical protein [Myxococcales bacterium]